MFGLHRKKPEEEAAAIEADTAIDRAVGAARQAQQIIRSTAQVNAGDLACRIRRSLFPNETF